MKTGQLKDYYMDWLQQEFPEFVSRYLTVYQIHKWGNVYEDISQRFYLIAKNPQRTDNGR